MMEAPVLTPAKSEYVSKGPSTPFLYSRLHAVKDDLGQPAENPLKKVSVYICSSTVKVISDCVVATTLHLVAPEVPKVTVIGFETWPLHVVLNANLSPLPYSVEVVLNPVPSTETSVWRDKSLLE